MGQIAEDALDGTTCSLCGMFFRGQDDPKQVTKDNQNGETLYTHGYPVVCWDCWQDLTKKERALHQRAQVRTL